ncbi:hypothetical protein VPNG_04637 [Cytospora leucostoma]|uniref:Uncharacterized protein n=1 Tax=Cytospora leucostoma TaxID=1230097 RepID=A0A423XCG9_9PEZI|nr:hypothetical protein VPNG_04637 [Cytospora leucostoma]
MVADFGIVTIPAVIGLVNGLMRIFRSISKWLKRIANTQWKEDHRYMKIVRDYFARNKTGACIQLLAEIIFLTLASGIVEPHIRYVIDHLKQRKIAWLENPAAKQADTEARAVAYHDEPGYTTDFEDRGEESPGQYSPGEDPPREESPGQDSPREYSPREESPYEDSLDDGSD